MVLRHGTFKILTGRRERGIAPRKNSVTHFLGHAGILPRSFPLGSMLLPVKPNANDRQSNLQSIDLERAAIDQAPPKSAGPVGSPAFVTQRSLGGDDEASAGRRSNRSSAFSRECRCWRFNQLWVSMEDAIAMLVFTRLGFSRRERWQPSCNAACEFELVSALQYPLRWSLAPTR